MTVTIDPEEYTVYKVPDIGYTVGLAPTGGTGEFGKVQMAYYLRKPNGATIFEGQDFYPSPMYACDGPEAAADLLSFLTVRPGDVEDDYFKDYTRRQKLWLHSPDVDDLSIFASDVEEGLIKWEPVE